MMRFFWYSLMTVLLFGMSVMTGCGSKKAEIKATYRQMGIEYMEQGDYAGAIDAFNAALSQGVGTVGADELDITYYKAAAQYASGDAKAAMATYNAIIDFDKDAYEAYYLRGCLYGKQGDIETAKDDFAKAVKYGGKDYALYLNIYENLAGLGYAEDGNAYLREALSFKGQGASDLEYKGQIYYLLGEYENAISVLEDALEIGSTYANLYLAKCYDDMGDTVTAEGYLKTYIGTATADAIALNELGEIMLGKELYAEAVAYFEQGLACDVIPNRGALLHNLVVAYEFNGNFDKAWEVVQEYVALFPEDENAQREYIFLKNRQMKEESTEDLETAE